ncbi:MAG: TerC/Alx family metal homeostasis membrane protein [Streptosporangiales bacterium]|nr:TerC/Alx family metal homeostasis membrane protein [Streptosporangiales bacterium]
MDLHAWVWFATIGGLLAVILADLYVVARNPREPSFRECLGWVTLYVSMAVVFGLAITGLAGGRYGGEFFAGWITEYSLSVDNLFVFMIIMSRFAVPRRSRQKVLLIGIVIALIMRGIFIAVGAAAIARFDWLFYIFGAFLVYTAYRLVTEKEEEAEFSENIALRMAKRVLPATGEYHDSRMTTKIDGRRVVTPMLIVMIAIGTTDLVFALDSIPAVFGLTQEPYLVFTVNAFALMGLRQLYFLIGGLLDRLVYLGKGLAFVLAFIGVKLMSEAAHHDGVRWAPEVPISVSLGVIAGTLAVTTVASLLASRRAARRNGPDASASGGPAPAEAASRPHP